MLLVKDEVTGTIHACRVGVPIVVGRRARSARVDVACDDKHVSRRHCELVAQEDGRLRVTDTSAHGTFLNGARLGKEGFAKPGDRLVLGHAYVLAVLDESWEAAGATTADPDASPGRAPPWKAAPAIGPIGGRYRLVRELGRGGMGIVHEAVDEFTKKRYALKRLPGMFASGQIAERFKREAMLAAKLGAHPAIVHIHDLGVAADTGDLYYAMDLVDGETLGRRVRNGLSRREAVGIVGATARIVAFAHAHGVIHRDLKPDNVLVTPDGQPRLIDFGVSKALDEGEGLTVTGALLGTPSFMAPEQIEDAKRAGPSSDVYALGAILYFVLVGEPPYEGSNMAGILARVRKSAFVPPRERDASVPAALDALVRRCLARDPARRPASADALAREIEEWLGSEHH